MQNLRYMHNSNPQFHKHVSENCCAHNQSRTRVNLNLRRWPYREETRELKSTSSSNHTSQRGPGGTKHPNQGTRKKKIRQHRVSILLLYGVHNQFQDVEKQGTITKAACSHPSTPLRLQFIYMAKLPSLPIDDFFRAGGPHLSHHRPSWLGPLQMPCRAQDDGDGFCRSCLLYLFYVTNRWVCLRNRLCCGSLALELRKGRGVGKGLEVVERAVGLGSSLWAQTLVIGLSVMTHFLHKASDLANSPDHVRYMAMSRTSHVLESCPFALPLDFLHLPTSILDKAIVTRPLTLKGRGIVFGNDSRSW